jgi:hypothetical protein
MIIFMLNQINISIMRKITKSELKKLMEEVALDVSGCFVQYVMTVKALQRMSAKRDRSISRMLSKRIK